MRAWWAATLLVLVPPSPASCATCTGTSVVPRVLALTHRHLHKSPSVRQPFAGISGNTAFSSLWFLSRKLCPIFVCHFKGSLHIEIVELVPGVEGVSSRQPFATGTAYQTSRLRIVVTCPTISAST